MATGTVKWFNDKKGYGFINAMAAVIYSFIIPGLLVKDLSP